MLEQNVPALYAVVFACSLLTALGLTPLARRLALSLDFVDRPSARKVHKVSTPYLGGVAIFTACMGAMAVGFEFHIPIAAWIGGSLLLVLLGLWDDRNGMEPRTKLLGQAAAGALVVLFGDRFELFGLPLADGALTLFWIVGLTNAVNLLDNMDGLSAGTTGISCFFLFLIAASNGQYLVGSLALSIAGACLGFLRYNFRPASIFMGDAGSLFLGFTLAVAGVRLRMPVSALWDFLVPVTVLGLPIFDTTLVTMMRIRAGRPVALGGKDHASHRLVALGLSQAQAVVALYGLAFIYGAMGLCGSWLVMAQPRDPGCVMPLVIALGISLLAFRKLAAVAVYQDPAVPAQAH